MSPQNIFENIASPEIESGGSIPDEADSYLFLQMKIDSPQIFS